MKQIIAIIIILLALGAGGGYYWWYSQHYVSTDDAYVEANIIQISSQVTGRINKVLVENNQYVKQDQILFTLDPVLFNLAVERAKSTLAKIKGKNPEMQQAQANLTQAELNLQHTLIKAPTAGWISDLNIQVGDAVLADHPLFALIDDQGFWIEANFKETDLEHIKSGQFADIKIDMYPGQKFQGKVDSISNATGSAFSLLPPENATGNWVKVTQRVPVQIKIVNLPKDKQLRVGTSANVTIKVK